MNLDISCSILNLSAHVWDVQLVHLALFSLVEAWHKRDLIPIFVTFISDSFLIHPYSTIFHIFFSLYKDPACCPSPGLCLHPRFLMIDSIRLLKATCFISVTSQLPVFLSSFLLLSILFTYQRKGISVDWFHKVADQPKIVTLWR